MIVDFKKVAYSDIPDGITKEVKTNYGTVASFIPIFELECMLDLLNWNTKKFQYNIFKDGYANLCVAASLELEISYRTPEDDLIIRTFVGACNFSLNSIEPNTHFLATAKSECIKNAATDIGKYFGRGMNNDIVPVQEAVEKKTGSILIQLLAFRKSGLIIWVQVL